jgi:hypothetical protein
VAMKEVAGASFECRTIAPHEQPSFRPKQADVFLPRSLPANASACAVEESLFDQAAVVFTSHLL